MNCKGGTSEIVCFDCDGRGYSYDVEGSVEDCDTCHGDGYLPADECPECSGGVVECQTCFGTGEVDDDFMPPASGEQDEDEDEDGNST